MSFLIRRDICDLQKVSVKLLCVYVCLSSDLCIFSVSFQFLYLLLCYLYFNTFLSTWSFCYFFFIYFSELDEMLGDTAVDIMKLESQILLRLVQFIQQRIAPLHTLVKKAAELDWLVNYK